MAGKELEQRLIDDGHKLLAPPYSIDDLLSILDRIEVSLSKVNQSPHGSMVAALSPLRIALVSDKLLRHSDTDVKVAVAACISQIIRITAPEAPYDDKKMTEVFHLIVAAFQKLSHMSSCCYSKVVSILVTIATTRAVVVMMDLDCHELIVEMFQLFLIITRSNNSDVVSAAMVAIMTIAILESDDISLEIVNSLLVSVRKENQNVAPASWKLGKEVIKNCAAKIGPCILRTVKSLGVSLDNYDQIIYSICQKATSNIKSFDLHSSEERLGQSMDFLGSESLKLLPLNKYGDLLAIKCHKAKITGGPFVMRGNKWEKKCCYAVDVPSNIQPASTKTCLDQSAIPWNCEKQESKNRNLYIPFSEDTFPANSGGANVCSETTLVQGYEVKTSLAAILTSIFAKYGDIAANCHYKSPTMRASLLETVCNIVQRLQSTDMPLTLSEIKVLKNEIKDLEGEQLKLSWLTQPLEKISEFEKIAEMHSMLKSVKANSMMIVKAATKELEEELTELVALQKRMGETENRIKAMKLVARKVDDAIKEAEDQDRCWLRQITLL
ncbi:conserved hypothetical protein [Ricinus communis]|uniref:Phospholipase-like protein n=1 Tax=Ricinus communis TaxID=3988 RepID=B9SMT2_RICCO|nr:conserved hypothetical protein [Ricinus communis]